MPGIFSPDNLPAWMNPTRNVIETGQEAIPIIAGNFSKAFSQKESEEHEKEMLRLRYQYGMQYEAEKKKQVQDQQQQVATKTIQIGSALQGAKTPEESWSIVSQNPQWLADPQTAPFVGKYLKTQADVAKAEVGTIAGKVAIADSTEFAKRSAGVDAETRAGIKAMQPNPDGTPSPMMWRALGLAEERMKVQAENKRAQAEIEAVQRGDVPTTTINEKGITQTFKPASETKPQEMTLSTGARIVYNPKGGGFQFVKDGKTQDFTKAQLLAIAAARKKSDAEDKDAQKIIDFLSGEALQQIGGSTNKVLKYNPATGKIE